MNDKLQKRAASCMNKALPVAPAKYETAEQLALYLNATDKVRKFANQAIDYSQGKELDRAKRELPHGEFGRALAEAGVPERNARRLMEWFKTAQRADLDAFKAEEKMSAKAREQLSRSLPQTVEKVSEMWDDEEVEKITTADVKELDDGFREIVEGFANMAEVSYKEAEEEVRTADAHKIWAEGKTQEVYDEDYHQIRKELLSFDDACALILYWKGHAEALQIGRDMDRADRTFDKDYLPIDVIKNRIPKLSDEEKEEIYQILLKDTSTPVTIDV